MTTKGALFDDMPSTMRAELARIGVVVPKPEIVQPPRTWGDWKPSYPGEEPPF